MKRMIVCGDSWMSPIDDNALFKNTHFSELLSAFLQYELIQYSQGGMSNGGICLQIEQAIKDKPDLILFNTSSLHRIEYAIGNLNSLESDGVINEATFSELGRKRDPNKKSHMMLSDNLVSLLASDQQMRGVLSYFYGCTEVEIQEKAHAMKEWFNFVYYPPMKLKIDRWCFFSVLTKLRDSGIPYIFVKDDIGLPEVTWMRPILNSWPAWPPGFVDSGYHTTPEQQVEIFNLIKSRL